MCVTNKVVLPPAPSVYRLSWGEALQMYPWLQPDQQPVLRIHDGMMLIPNYWMAGNRIAFWRWFCARIGRDQAMAVLDRDLPGFTEEIALLLLGESQ